MSLMNSWCELICVWVRLGRSVLCVTNLLNMRYQIFCSWPCILSSSSSWFTPPWPHSTSTSLLAKFRNRSNYFPHFPSIFMTSETPTNGVPAFVCGRASRLPERRVRRMADGDANAMRRKHRNATSPNESPNHPRGLCIAGNQTNPPPRNWWDHKFTGR